MLPRGLLKEYSSILAMLMRGLDMAIVLISAWIAYTWRFHELTFSYFYYLAVLWAIFLTPIIFSFCHIYVSLRGASFLRHMINLMEGVGGLGLVLAGFAFFTKTGDAFSRVWFVLWLVLTLVLLVFTRFCLLLLLRFMRTHGLNERRVIIYGANELGMALAASIQQALWTGFRIVGLLDDEENHPTTPLSHIPLIKMSKDLSAMLTEQGIDEIWIALPLAAEAKVKAILFQLRHHTITTRLVLDIFGLDLLNHSITDVAGFPVLNIRSSPMVGMNRLIKAIEDRVLATLILIVISPLFALIALGVRLSSEGPIFFKQKRLGWDGKIIKVYKFRTMYLHEEPKGQLLQATVADKRITPFGRWLRRTSLDELPQFINVLQGRMSIVGPRPHALVHNELYKETVHTYMQRHRMKPGITGWAQVNGWRGETDTLNKMQKRVEYDLYYINNWSLGFDLQIILLTIFRGFIHRNAY